MSRRSSHVHLKGRTHASTLLVFIPAVPTQETSAQLEAWLNDGRIGDRLQRDWLWTLTLRNYNTGSTRTESDTALGFTHWTPWSHTSGRTRNHTNIWDLLRFDQMAVELTPCTPTATPSKSLKVWDSVGSCSWPMFLWGGPAWGRGRLSGHLGLSNPTVSGWDHYDSCVYQMLDPSIFVV